MRASKETSRDLAISVRDSLLDPDRSDDRVLYRKLEGDQWLYRLFLYLDGPDLPFVESASYELHETFSPRVQRVVRSLSNARCKLQIWTWGIFDVKVTIEDTRGATHVRTHSLQYGRQLQEIPKEKFRATSGSDVGLLA